MGDHHTVRRIALVTCVVCLASTGCVEGVDSDPSSSSPAANQEFSRKARVRVQIQPHADKLEPEPSLQVQARFVEYRGVEEAFVQARADLAPLALDVLAPGLCVETSTLTPAHSSDASDEREINMIDAGDMRITLGDENLVVPLALVPDLLSYVSGVEYSYAHDSVPSLAPGPDGTIPITIAVDGVAEDELHGFRVTTEIPTLLEFEGAQDVGSALRLAWEPPASSAELISFRLQAFDDDTPVGEEAICLVPDSGRADLEWAALYEAGVAHHGDTLRVTGSRLSQRNVDDGAFRAIEVLVEVRDQVTLAR